MRRSVCLRLTALLVLGASLLASGAARALEEVVVQVPLLETPFTLKLSELQDPRTLLRGNSDLAELDRASGGAIGQRLIDLLNQPVPLTLVQVANGSVGSPLLEQAILVLSSLGTVEGRSPDLSGQVLREALLQASANGQPTLLALMRAIPGERVRLDLGRAGRLLARMASQRSQADALLARVQPAAPPAALSVAPSTSSSSTTTTTPSFSTSSSAVSSSAAPMAPLGVQRLTQTLPVAHRAEPLELVVLRPAGAGNGRLVLISHGLWDGPANFEGWARLLAGRGYTVVLPRHPGSDNRQQQAVLNGEAPPPGPEELARRPRDLSAVINAVADGTVPAGTVSDGTAPGTTASPGSPSPGSPASAGSLPSAGGAVLDTRRVVVLGHSWGATTALQLAGLRPTDAALRARCGDVQDPERNLSWTLQCSWLQGVEQAGYQDPRVVAVAAVSPPVSLLFPAGSGGSMSARVLLVSGSRDWVVPPDPEAIAPMARGAVPVGHRLVLAQGGDHFNLRPGAAEDGGVLGALLLTWTDAAFAAGEAARPAPGAPSLLPASGWGSAGLPLVDVTDQL